MFRRKFMLFTVLSPFIYASSLYNEKLPAKRFSVKQKSLEALSQEQLEDKEIQKALEKMRKEPLDPIIKEVFGDIKPLLEGIKVTLPKHSSNASRVPINIRSNLNAKHVVLFANPDSCSMCMIAKWKVPENEMVDYSLTFMLVSPSYGAGVNELKKVKVVIEDRNGMHYLANTVTRVAISGPEE